MLDFLKNVLSLNAIVSQKITLSRLVDEGISFREAGEYKNAIQAFRSASDLGSPEASAQLGDMLMRGLGIETNWAEAVKYLEFAIGKNIPAVSINVGLLYGIGGWGLKRNSKRAEHFLSLAWTNENDSAALEMLDRVRRKKPPFGGKEISRPKIPWDQHQ